MSPEVPSDLCGFVIVRTVFLYEPFISKNEDQSLIKVAHLDMSLHVEAVPNKQSR